MSNKNVLFTNDQWKIAIGRYLLSIFFIFSCLFQGQSNGRPIPTTHSSNQDLQPLTSSSQNDKPSMYSRYWISYASILFPKTTDDNQGDSSTDDSRNSSPDQSSVRRESIKSTNPSSDRRQSIWSHDQRLSPSFDYDEAITHSPHPSLADTGSSSPSDMRGGPSSSDSDLRVGSSADNVPRISSWRPISLHDQGAKDHESPMILFDEQGEMHRNYYTSSMGHDKTNEQR